MGLGVLGEETLGHFGIVATELEDLGQLVHLLGLIVSIALLLLGSVGRLRVAVVASKEEVSHLLAVFLALDTSLDGLKDIRENAAQRPHIRLGAILLL